MEKQWTPISEADGRHNLPTHIVEWKHPEYGIIEGSLIGGEKDSLWILPCDGCSAEIWLGEFKAYRK